MSELHWNSKDIGKVTPNEEQTQNAVNAYLRTVITNPDSPPLDRTLSSDVSAAPADMVGALKSAFKTGQYSDFADIVIPCSDGDVTVTGYTVKKIGNALLFDGSRQTSTQRYCIYGSFEYAGNSPSYSNHPEWYHTGLAEFIVGHVYKFRWRLISGSIDKNGVTDNFYYDMRTSSGGSQQIYLANDNVWGDEWTCTFVPEMIAFVSPQFIYSNAVILLDVVDKTKEFADFPMLDRFNADSQAVLLNCRLWHSETDGNYAYVKFGASNGSIYIRGFNTHATITPASYVSSGLVVTSPSGVENCWKIPYNSALYFDRGDSTVKITTSAYTSNSVLLIYVGTSGQIQTNKTFLNETEIDNLKAQVADVIPYTVPDYFKTHMNTQIAKIQTAINAGKESNVSTDVESFVFITDIHWEKNKQNSPSLVKDILNKTSVKTVICGGDFIEGHNDTKEGALQEIHGFTNRIMGIPCFDYYAVYGNHDNNGNSNDDISIKLTPEEEFNALYAPFAYKDNVHWIWEDVPSIFESSVVKNDYYFDHERTKTRFICIDWKNPFINTKRATWFQSVLAKDDGYRVIVIYHGMWKPDFTPDRNNSEAIMSYIEPYKNKVVAVITGHTHVDSDPAVDYFGDGSVPVIVTACDTFDPSHNTGMVAGTITEQCFDVFVVDYENSKIKVIRIGNGSDREVDISVDYDHETLPSIENIVADIERTKADIITVSDSETSAIKTFPDGADGLPMALTVGIEPVQDLHGYENPWPGGGGKNIADPSQFVDNKYLNYSSSIADNNSYWISGYQKVDPSTTYTISPTPSGSFCSLYNSNKELINSVAAASTTPFTTTAETAYVVWCYSKNNLAFGGNTQLEKGSTATTYAPYSNICPISGWTGAKVSRANTNLLPNIGKESFTVGEVTFTKVSGMHYKVNGTSNATAWLYMFDSTYANICPIDVPYGTYTIKCSSSDIRSYLNEKGTQHNDYGTFTYTGKPDQVQFLLPSGKTFNNADVYFQLNKGNVALDYEDTETKTYPITFPSSAGTVYGGTLTVNKDGSGELVVDRYHDVLDGSKTYNKWSSSTPLVRYNPSISAKPVSNNYEVAKIISSYIKTINASTVANYDVDGIAVAAIGSIIFKMNGLTYDENIAYITSNPLQIVYELATPTTYSLTAEQIKTLLGVNNVWSDTGDILSVNYPADMKLYIDKKFAELSAEITALGT